MASSSRQIVFEIPTGGDESKQDWSEGALWATSEVESGDTESGGSQVGGPDLGDDEDEDDAEGGLWSPTLKSAAAFAGLVGTSAFRPRRRQCPLPGA